MYTCLLEISTFELMKLWGELVEALHGKASHGDVAEIYSYRLAVSSPYVDQLPKSEIANKEYEARGIRLHSLLMLFAHHYDCSISLGIEQPHIPLSIEWRRCIPYPFDHRIHVKIQAKKCQ